MTGVMYEHAIHQAIRAAGSQAKLAAIVGKKQGHVSRWLSRRRIPAQLVLPIEAATGVSRHELRPDVFGPAPAQFTAPAASEAA